MLEERLIGIAPPGHRLGGASLPVGPVELAAEGFVAFDGRVHRSRREAQELVPFTQLVDDWFAAAQIRPPIRFATTSHEGIKTAVRLGVGVAIVSSVAVQRGDTSLCTFELAAAPRRSFVAVYRRSGWRSAAWRAFVDFTLSYEWGNLSRAP